MLVSHKQMVDRLPDANNAATRRRKCRKVGVSTDG
jgi:hypothetical protein